MRRSGNWEDERQMSRLSILDDSEMPAALREQAQAADRAGAGSTVLRVLAHSPEMIENYFKFYYPAHNGGAVGADLKELVRLRIAEHNNCFT
jgi:hypothetical protein